MPDSNTPPAGAHSGEGASGEPHSATPGASGTSPPPGQGGQGLTADQVREVVGAELKGFRDSIFATLRRGGQHGDRGGNEGAPGPATPPAGSGEDGASGGAKPSGDLKSMSKAELVTLLEESQGRLRALEQRDTERQEREATAERERFLDQKLGIHRSPDGTVTSDTFAMPDLLLEVIGPKVTRGQDGKYYVRGDGGALRPFDEVLAEYAAQPRFKPPAGGEGSGGVEPGRTPRRTPARQGEPDFSTMSEDDFKKYQESRRGKASGLPPGSI